MDRLTILSCTKIVIIKHYPGTDSGSNVFN